MKKSAFFFSTRKQFFFSENSSSDEYNVWLIWSTPKCVVSHSAL